MAPEDFAISVTDLALFSGTPRFDASVHVGRPNIGDRKSLNRRIEAILDRRWLTNNGPVIQEFEARLKEYLGVRHCIPVCNATIGLELAIRALCLEGEVIVPSFTFVATPHSLQWQGITPVFCDIDPLTHCLDPERVEELITPRTTGVIGVHVWGRPSAIDELSAIAERNGLSLMFDAAHAFGCSDGAVMIGNFGRAEVFSFHATKFLNSFEGGAIATNDDALAAKLRLMLNFGFAGLDRVDHIGTNGKMSEVSAAMGLTSLESIDEFIGVNRQNHRRYREELQHADGISVVHYDAQERQNFQYIVCEVDGRAGLTRDEIVQVLAAENVLARRYFYPGCHRMEPYASAFTDAGSRLTNTENLCSKVMVLPNGQSIDSEAISSICRIIALALENCDTVRERLSAPAQ